MLLTHGKCAHIETTNNPLPFGIIQHFSSFRFLVPNFCKLPADPGPCRMAITSFYFDAREGICRQFEYGACDGNDNRFVNAEMCREVCKPSNNPPNNPFDNPAAYPPDNPAAYPLATMLPTLLATMIPTLLSTPCLPSWKPCCLPSCIPPAYPAACPPGNPAAYPAAYTPGNHAAYPLPTRLPTLLATLLATLLPTLLATLLSILLATLLPTLLATLLPTHPATFLLVPQSLTSANFPPIPATVGLPSPVSTLTPGKESLNSSSTAVAMATTTGFSMRRCVGRLAILFALLDPMASLDKQRSCERDV